MGLLANLKLRRKLLLAMAPLAVMVIIAGVYSSVRSSMIDTWYTALIDNEVKAGDHIDNARAFSLRYALSLYRLVAETDADRRQVIDWEVDSSYAAFKTQLAEASAWPRRGKRESRRSKMNLIEPFLIRAPSVPLPSRVTRRK